MRSSDRSRPFTPARSAAFRSVRVTRTFDAAAPEDSAPEGLAPDALASAAKPVAGATLTGSSPARTAAGLLAQRPAAAGGNSTSAEAALGQAVEAGFQLSAGLGLDWPFRELRFFPLTDWVLGTARGVKPCTAADAGAESSETPIAADVALMASFVSVRRLFRRLFLAINGLSPTPRKNT